MWAWSGAGAGPEAVPPPPPSGGPEGTIRASVSAGASRRAELRPEDATRAQFRRGGRASDSDGGGVGAPSCGEAAGAPGCEPGPQEGERREGGRAGGAGGRWERRGPCNGRGPGELGFFVDPEPGPTERRGAARSSQPAGPPRPRLGAEDRRGGRAFRLAPGFGRSRQMFPRPSRATLSAGWGSCGCAAAQRPEDPCSPPLPLTGKTGNALVFRSSAPGTRVLGEGVSVLHRSDILEGGNRL